MSDQQILDRTPWEAVGGLAGKVDQLVEKLDTLVDVITSRAPEPLRFAKKSQLMKWFGVSGKTLDNLLDGVPYLPLSDGEKIHKRYLVKDVEEKVLKKMRGDADDIKKTLEGNEPIPLQPGPVLSISRHFEPGGPALTKMWQGRGK